MKVALPAHPARRPLMPLPRSIALRPLLAALAAAAMGASALHLASAPASALFISSAARLAGLLAGVPATPLANGWALGFTHPPLLVTTLCSATDFFLLTATLLGWHFGRRTRHATQLLFAIPAALAAALPLAIFINALRLIAVAQGHRWASPHLPPAYDGFLHLLTGIAVFLPALIALNLLLEIYGRPRPLATA